ncbi:MAG: hypothetical protein ACTSVV_15595 [Promethearchaeota archaeon]
MLSFEEDFLNTLKRIDFLFENQKILTECIKNYEGFTLFGEKIGPFVKGKKYELKFFLAKHLIKANILKVAPPEKCDHIDVQRYAIAERDDLKLVKWENNFFLNKIKAFSEFLEQEVKHNIRNKTDLDMFKSYALNVIDNRLLKLLRIAKTNLNLSDEARITIAEKELLTRISGLISIWRKFFV